jgi:hypothetical protein
MTRREKRIRKRDYRKGGLGNQNASRKGDVSYVLFIDGQQVSGIDRSLGRVTFSSSSSFPFVFNTPQGVKSFLRMAARLGNSFPQSSVSVMTIASK